MIMAGVERFVIELIRVNTRYVVAGISFTQAEMISVIMVLRRQRVDIRRIR
jgi:phosphatidylglycerol:prolipoprotein diacylglycerol transferase